MRLLITTTAYFPEEQNGPARLAHDLALESVRQGHEVWLISQTVNSGVPRHIADQGLHVLRYKLAPARGLDVLRHLRHINATKSLLTEYVGIAPDAIHGHDFFTYVAALDHYRDARPRTCYSIHSPATDELAIVWQAQGTKGLLRQVLGLPIIRHYERRVLSASDALAAESSFTRSRIEAIYDRELSDRIQVIPGWIESGRFAILPPDQVRQVRQRLGWPLGRPVFFSLRRLEVRMGLDRFLHAIAEVRQSGLDVYTVIAGSGGERQALEDLREQLGLQEHVEFMGRVSEELLPLAYGASDASIIPTRALECFGIIALEGMATGRPVLVTPIGSLPEVVGAFEPQWVAAGNEASHIAAIMRAFLQGQLPEHAPETIAQYVSDHYQFSHSDQQYRVLLGL